MALWCLSTLTSVLLFVCELWGVCIPFYLVIVFLGLLKDLLHLKVVSESMYSCLYPGLSSLRLKGYVMMTSVVLKL